MFSTILTALLSKAIPSAADFFIAREKLQQEAKLEELRGKAEWQRAMTQRASESEGRDHEWELAMIDKAGWKDEWVLGLISVPLVGVFIPQTQQGVLEGFRILEQTPVWYQGMVVTIFFAVYGIRKWRRKTAATTLLEGRS